MILSQIFTNAYFYITASSVAILVALLVIVARRAEAYSAIRWFQFYIYAILMISIAQVLQFFGQSAAIFDFAQALFTVGVVIYTLAFFYFVLSFLGKVTWLENFWLMAILVGSAVAVLIFGLRTYNLYAQDPALRILQPWGYIVPGAAKYFAVFTTWVETLNLASIALMIHAHRHTVSRDRKRQILTLIIGVSIPVIIGGITQGLLPIFGINILPSTIYVQALEGMVLTFALLHYGSTAIDPGAIAASIVRTMSSAALAVDQNNEVIFANIAASHLLGYSSDHLVGQSIQRFIAPKEWPKFNQAIIPKQNSSDDHTNESTVVTSAGVDVAVNVYSSSYQDKSRRVLGTILILANVQDLKDLLVDAHRLSRELAAEKKGVEAKVVKRTHELHEEQARLHASIEGLPVGFLLIDGQGEIVIQNKSFNNITGLKSDVASVTQLKELLGDFDLDIERKKILESGQASNFKEVGLGSKILRVFLGPVRLLEGGQSTVIGTIVLFEDITEEKVIARSKDEFFSIASHELRTPLTGIKGNASMIIDYYPEFLKDPALKEMVYDIHEASEHLIAIVGDFMDVSRLEQGKMQFNIEDFELSPIIETVVYEMRTTLREKHLYLNVEPKTLDALPKVRADKDRAKQILYNLVNNAMKYTEKGGATIAITLFGNTLKILVSDTGRGISTEMSTSHFLQHPVTFNFSF
jgi:PAS domain S-box-containing protein